MRPSIFTVSFSRTFVCNAFENKDGMIANIYAFKRKVPSWVLKWQ